MISLSPSGFNSFVHNVEDSISEIEVVLGVMLPDSPEQLTVQLRKAEAWYAYANGILSDANGFLDVAESAALPARADGLTELDRKTAQTAAVAQIRAFRDRMEGISKAINVRLMLGMSLLKHHESERRGLGGKVGE